MMRADARKNYSHLLAVARDVVAEHGVDASMRDIARRADVGLDHIASSFPDAGSLVRSVAAYESGGTDAEGRRTRNVEST